MGSNFRSSNLINLPSIRPKCAASSSVFTHDTLPNRLKCAPIAQGHRDSTNSSSLSNLTVRTTATRERAAAAGAHTATAKKECIFFVGCCPFDMRLQRLPHTHAACPSRFVLCVSTFWKVIITFTRADTDTHQHVTEPSQHASQLNNTKLFAKHARRVLVNLRLLVPLIVCVLCGYGCCPAGPVWVGFNEFKTTYTHNTYAHYIAATIFGNAAIALSTNTSIWLLNRQGHGVAGRMDGARSLFVN